MKRLIFSLLIALGPIAVFSQTLPDFEAIPLDKKEDFNSTADSAALQASSFLLSTPMEKNNLNRLRSMQYVIRWMTGTPGYSFTLDAQATRFAKKSDDLLALYMAAMTKHVLENKTNASDQNQIKLNALRLIILYAKDEQNNVKLNSELKKIMEAEEKGKLAEYLKIKP